MVTIMSGGEALSKATKAGYMKPLSRLEMSDKHDIISVLTTYHLFIKAKVAMDQLKEGLEFFGICIYIPDLPRPLFVNERTPLTSSECTNQLRVGLSLHSYAIDQVSNMFTNHYILRREQ